jgi:hypothetical protein
MGCGASNDNKVAPADANNLSEAWDRSKEPLNEGEREIWLWFKQDARSNGGPFRLVIKVDANIAEIRRQVQVICSLSTKYYATVFFMVNAL